MKYNNEYTKLVNKLDASDEFKKNLIERIKEEEINKGIIKMKIKNKITGLIASLGIITCSGIVYATVVPVEIKNTINNKISAFFGIETNYNEEIDYDIGIQEETLDDIIASDKENLEDYSELTNPEIYGIGDSNSGTLLESNYKQYDWNSEYDEDGNIVEKTIKEYEEAINIKIGKVNSGCIEKLNNENMIIDEFGNVLETKETTIEETLEYQYNEFKTNWNEYYYGEEEFKEQLYFKITGMLIMNGNNSSEEDYYNHARAKKIKVIFNEQDEKIINLEDTKNVQFIDLQYIHYDISKPVNISVEVLEMYEGKVNNDIYVADVQFGISSNIPQGR